MKRTTLPAIPAAVLARCATRLSGRGLARPWQCYNGGMVGRRFSGAPRQLTSSTPADAIGTFRKVEIDEPWIPSARLTRFGLQLALEAGPPRYLSTLWLRDACPCPQCVDPDSGQKNFSTTDLPDNPKIKYAQLNADGSLTLEWPNDKLSGGKNHISTFPADEVQSWAVHEQARGSVVPNEPGCRLLWDRTTYESLLNDGRCSLSYDFWMNSDEAFWRVFSDLVETGLIFIYDVPDREQEVERIARRIGILMHTFYGHTWDVKSKPKAENVAYTSAFLGLHQDLLYYDPVPKLQLLHCLANSCEGGESLFSNGIRAAYEVKLTNSLHYDVLTRHQNPFYYQKGEHHYFHRHPTIGGAAKDMYPRSVYWAPPFQTTFGRFDPQLGRWKAAATRFQQIVESPRNMVEMKLKPGVCVIFDNRRILHGRRQFAADTGSRWLQGCYISPQVYLAKVTEMLAREGRLTYDNSLAVFEQEERMVKQSLSVAQRLAEEPEPTSQGKEKDANERAEELEPTS